MEECEIAIVQGLFLILTFKILLETYDWEPNECKIDVRSSRFKHGIRSVLRFASSVIATGGTGIYEEPY